MRNRTAVGPFVRLPAKPLQAKKAECFVVLMKDQRQGDEHGRWQPISTNGFAVVCLSRLEACECVWFVGGRYFPRPDHMVRDTENADFEYLRWLLDHHFKLVPHTSGDLPMEVFFSDFIRGWYPSAEDVLRCTNKSAQTLVNIEAALRFRWGGL